MPDTKDSTPDEWAALEKALAPVDWAATELAFSLVAEGHPSINKFGSLGEWWNNRVGRGGLSRAQWVERLKTVSEPGLAHSNLGLCCQKIGVTLTTRTYMELINAGRARHFDAARPIFWTEITEGATSGNHQRRLSRRVRREENI